MKPALGQFDEIAPDTVLGRERHAASAATNFLTIDVEEYFHVNYTGCDTAALRNGTTNIEAQIDRLLSLCAEAEIRCTFFALGEVGGKYPAVIRKIHAAGHELASHGYSHKAIHEMTAHEFRLDLERSCGVLETLTGQKVLGFRAPSFSVTAKTLSWFYETLERCGFTYSSSVFSGRTFLYGIPGFPREPHRPVVQGRKLRIVELPITVLEVFGKRFPLYVRLLSAGALKRGLCAANRAGYPGIVYVHPREIDPAQPRLPLSPGQALIHYWGVRGCEAKLRRLTREDLHFGTMREYVASLSRQ